VSKNRRERAGSNVSLEGEGSGDDGAVDDVEAGMSSVAESERLDEAGDD